MPNLTQKLLYAARQSYQVNANGAVADAPNSNEIGWTTPPIGYVAGFDNIDAALVGEIDSAIVVAFRGTLPPNFPDQREAFLDWLNDFDALLVTDPAGLAGKVHQGFKNARDNLWPAVGTAIAALAAARPEWPIYVTGHSKGGAVANLAAARLRKELPASQMYVCTFAAARPGDDHFATDYNAAIPHSDRYEYQDDVVPHVPLSDPFAALVKHVPEVDDLIGHFNDGFESVGRLYFIDWDDRIVADSPLLHIQRFTSLAGRFVDLEFGRIAADHSIAPSSGYADAPYI